MGHIGRLVGLGMSLLLAGEGSAPAAEPARPAEPGTALTVKVKLKTPKSARDQRMGQTPGEVSMSMYVPAGAKVIRGAVLNPFYEDTVKQAHWRAAVGLWDFALIGTNFFGVRNDELGETLLAGLRRLAEASGRAEVANVPLCPVGMSIGAGLTTRIVEAMPDRVLAAGPVCLEVGPRDAPSGSVPMITLFGERDGRQMELLAGKLPEARARGARWATAVQWRLRHDFARANNLLMPLFARAIAHRYPRGATPQAGPVKLTDRPLADGWLGDPNTWAGDLATIAPAKDYKGDPARACWLPDAYVAAVWQAFVVREPKLSIAAPDGLGDGKPFSTHPAGRAIGVRVTLAEGLAPKRLELYDGDRRLAAFGEGKLELTLDGLAPGVHALIAVATDPAGRKLVSRPNTLVVVPAEKAAPAGPTGARGATGRRAAEAPAGGIRPPLHASSSAPRYGCPACEPVRPHPRR